MRRWIPALAAVVLLTAPLPLQLTDEGSAQTEGPTDPLEEAQIVRDAYGVPHVYADSERALWYANGYVQAQDRLWAMDLLRHLSYGEGASVVGPGGGILEMDLNTRRNLYNETNLERQMEQADPVFVERVEHYVDGVNRAAAQMQATGEVPAEFPALQHAFEPWEPIDTIAVATFLLAEFGNGGGQEVANAQLLGQLEAQLGPAKAKVAFDDLVWGQRGDSYATIQEDTYTRAPQNTPDLAGMPAEQRAATEGAMRATSFGLDAEPVLPTPASTQSSATLGIPDVGLLAGAEVGPGDFKLGSNALLVGPEFSESGDAMFGGGPQMGYYNPEIPYEVGLHAGDEGIEAEGMGVTGAPGVIIGRSDDFAWSVTSGISDQTDVVALPAAGDRSYEWTDENGDTEVRDLDCRTERHRLFAPPAIWGPATQEDPNNATLPVNLVEQEVCRADLSPVGQAPGKTYPVTAITRAEDTGEPTWFFAEKTSSRMEEVASAIQWLSLDEADNFDEFQQRFEGFAFTFNFHYAGLKEDAPDDEAICYVHVGKQPIRADNLDPRMPTPAGDAWQWGDDSGKTTLTGDELPRACNPDKGYFANWNNLPQEGWPSGDSRELWGSVHRVERLDQEFQEAIVDDPNNKLNLAQVKAVLEDAATEDSLANQIVPLFTGDTQDPNNVATAVPDVAKQALRAWADGGADSDYPWRAGTNTTAPDDARVSNHSDADYTRKESELVYVDAGHTVYDRVLEILLDEVFGDELGNHTRDVNMDPRDSSDPHAGDHGQHNNPFGVLVDALKGHTDRNWCNDVTEQGSQSCAVQVAEAFARAGFSNVESTSDIDLTPQHKSPFTSLGVGPAYQIPMSNRATFYHFHVGSNPATSTATLPAGASGHMSVADFAAFTATGEEPEHMDDQLPLYVDFQHKPMPWTMATAQEDADSTETLLVPGPLSDIGSD